MKFLRPVEGRKLQDYCSQIHTCGISVTATANIPKPPPKPPVPDEDRSNILASSENTRDSSTLGKHLLVLIDDDLPFMKVPKYVSTMIVGEIKWLCCCYLVSKRLI